MVEMYNEAAMLSAEYNQLLISDVERKPELLGKLLKSIGNDDMKYCPRCGENIPGDQECNCYFRDITNRINYELKYGTKTEKFTNEIKKRKLTEREHESIID